MYTINILHRCTHTHTRTHAHTHTHNFFSFAVCVYVNGISSPPYIYIYIYIYIIYIYISLVYLVTSTLQNRCENVPLKEMKMDILMALKEMKMMASKRPFTIKQNENENGQGHIHEMFKALCNRF